MRPSRYIAALTSMILALALALSFFLLATTAEAAPLGSKTAHRAANYFAYDLAQDLYLDCRRVDMTAPPTLECDTGDRDPAPWITGSPSPDHWWNEVSDGRRISRSTFEFRITVTEYFDDDHTAVACDGTVRVTRRRDPLYNERLNGVRLAEYKFENYTRLTRPLSISQNCRPA